MICNKCGMENEKDAKFCTKCGNSFEEIRDKMGNITLFRTKKFYGCFVGIKVFIDGKEVAILKNGKEVSIPVSIGKHKIMFDLWSGNEAEEIEITEDKSNLKLTVQLKVGALTAKPKIVDYKYIDNGEEKEFVNNLQNDNSNNAKIESDESGSFNVFAIISFVISIINIFIINLWLAIIAIVLAAPALKKIASFNQKGKGLAITALILAAIEFIIWLIYVVFSISLIF